MITEHTIRQAKRNIDNQKINHAFWKGFIIGIFWVIPISLAIYFLK